MVLAVGNDDDGTAYLFLLGEAVERNPDGLGNIGALRGNQRWVDILKDHLGRHVVARNGKLYEGIAGEYHQSHLVVGKVVYHALHEHLALVETRWNNILCLHRVTDVERYHGLDAISLLARYLGSHLRTGKHHDEQGQRRHQQPELHFGTEARHVGHQLLQQVGVAELLQLFAAPADGIEPQECQNGYQHQQVEI